MAQAPEPGGTSTMDSPLQRLVGIFGSGNEEVVRFVLETSGGDVLKAANTLAEWGSLPLGPQPPERPQNMRTEQRAEATNSPPTENNGIQAKDEMKIIYDAHILGHCTMVIIRGHTLSNGSKLSERILDNTIGKGLQSRSNHVFDKRDYSLNNNEQVHFDVELAYAWIESMINYNCSNGLSPIIILESNIQANLEPYFRIAIQHGYYVNVINPQNRDDLPNTDNIMANLIDRYDPTVKPPKYRREPPFCHTHVFMLRQLGGLLKEILQGGVYRIADNENSDTNDLNDEIEIPLSMDLIRTLVGNPNIDYDGRIQLIVFMSRTLLSALWAESEINQMGNNRRMNTSGSPINEVMPEEETLDIPLPEDVLRVLGVRYRHQESGILTEELPQNSTQEEWAPVLYRSESDMSSPELVFTLNPQISVYKSVLRTLWDQSLARQLERLAHLNDVFVPDGFDFNA